jgi:hypothetical protein
MLLYAQCVLEAILSITQIRLAMNGIKVILYLQKAYDAAEPSRYLDTRTSFACKRRKELE